MTSGPETCFSGLADGPDVGINALTTGASHMDQVNRFESPTAQTIHAVQLVIVQRSRFATFGLLAEAFADEPTVRLIWDRRGEDRQRSTRSPGPKDQRRVDRRRDPSPTWGDLDYLVLSAPAGSLPGDQRVAQFVGARDAQPAAVRMARDDVRRDIEAAVRSDVNVLITGGESLSRKSLARQIHRRSDPASGPLVVVDRRLATELFGGSGSDQPGESRALDLTQRDASWTNSALRGTLLIEEVADLTWEQQTKLLALLERLVVRGDGTQTCASRDPRLITATDCCLLDRIASSQFRADLFYCLNLIHVVLPSGRVRTLGSLPRLDS